MCGVRACAQEGWDRCVRAVPYCTGSGKVISSWQVQVSMTAWSRAVSGFNKLGKLWVVSSLTRLARRRRGGEWIWRMSELGTRVSSKASSKTNVGNTRAVAQRLWRAARERQRVIVFQRGMVRGLAAQVPKARKCLDPCKSGDTT